MNLEVLESEIGDVRGDIESLKSEVAAIEAEKEELALKVQALEQELLQSQPPPDSPRQKDSEEVPSIIQHSHFDSSIAKFFKSAEESRAPEPEVSPNLLHQASALVEIKENILYENVFRIGGITAFPINSRLFAPGDEVLGLRFDMFSHVKNSFLQPYYAILKKSTTIDKADEQIREWALYRHTLPVYLPLEHYLKDLQIEDGISSFAIKVRTFLVKTQFKHDVIGQLQEVDLDSIIKPSETAGLSGSRIKVVQKIDKDLQCQRVTLGIISKRGEKRKLHEIELNCNIDSVEIARISIIDSKHDKVVAMCEGLLRGCDFSSLVKTFRKIIELLCSKSIVNP